MAFKNLQQRYNEKVNDLYRGATSKFDGGRASRGANDDPLIVRKPGDGYWGFGETRGTPIRSAAQDVKRLTLFTLSTRGVAFLAKQQLLQTGNMFAKTRVLNPTFVVANAIPFLHVQRNLDVSNPASAIKGALGITAIQDLISRPQVLSGDALRRAGQLQIETYNKLLPPNQSTVRGIIDRIPFVSQLKGVVSSAIGQEVGRPEIADGRGQYFVARLTQSTSEDQPTPPTQPKSLLQRAGDFLKRKTLGETTPNGTFKYGGKVTSVGFTGQRYGYIQPNATPPTTINVNGFVRQLPQLPQNTKNLVTYLGDNTNQPDYTNDVRTQIETAERLSTYRTEKLSSTGQGSRKDVADGDMPTPIQQLALRDYQETVSEYFRTEFGEDITPFLKYFTSGQGSITKLSDGKSTDGSPTTFSANRALASSQLGKVSYIKDPLNYPLQTNKNRLTPYATLPSDESDAIVVSFAMSKDEPVQFRAFISDIQENTVPQYKSYQYIGRIEKFISYSSVQRNLSFKLELVSFSKDELQTMWRRVNFLTGLAFPYGINKGLLQPNIMKVTIGNLYKDQPAYIQNISSNFSEASWDIRADAQVPMRVTVNMQLVLIEKRTSLADSPFYGINEVLGSSGFVVDRNPASGPSQQLNTPTEATTDEPATDTPALTSVLVQSRTSFNIRDAELATSGRNPFGN